MSLTIGGLRLNGIGCALVSLQESEEDRNQHAVSRSKAPRKQGSAIPQVLAHSSKDNVGVVVIEGLTADTEAMGVITENNTTFSVDVKDDIPIGHKIALTDLKKGDIVIKYGQDVGRMVAPAPMGHHVHTQNLKTNRW
jgi:(2R)-sulfolactate sulfo-lyase subunit alpha